MLDLTLYNILIIRCHVIMIISINSLIYIYIYIYIYIIIINKI